MNSSEAARTTPVARLDRIPLRSGFLSATLQRFRGSPRGFAIAGTQPYEGSIEASRFRPGRRRFRPILSDVVLALLPRAQLVESRLERGTLPFVVEIAEPLGKVPAHKL